MYVLGIPHVMDKRITWNDDDDDDVIVVLDLDSRLEANMVKLAKVKVKSKLTHLRMMCARKGSKAFGKKLNVLRIRYRARIDVEPPREGIGNGLIPMGRKPSFLREKVKEIGSNTIKDDIESKRDINMRLIERRIAWNDDNDEIDVLGLDSRFEAKLVKLAKVNVKSKLTHLSASKGSKEFCKRLNVEARNRYK
ncbi:hypothetical protein Tco_0209497 [Tanacetum coccineum]